ncbi:putative N protein [Maize associated rhabdovirus]|uniref:Nucleoprotein n=1 Tax=Maize associated rhabdovirus TaxID=2003308 RepID=A0A1X9Y2V1_9RHAB|nr:putative N protein [Maize associated rhabdovirus]ARS22490.1 putative N protein [Maize associated rhabdovirus]
MRPRSLGFLHLRILRVKMASGSEQHIDKDLTDAFSNVPENLAVNTVPDETFSDDAFKSHSVYEINELTIKQVVHHAYKLFRNMGQKTCHAIIPYSILAMALRLPTPKKKSTTSFLTSHKPSGGTALEQGIASKLYPSLDLSTEEAAKPDAEKKRLTATKVFGSEEDKEFKAVRELEEEIVFQFGCFLSAFLLKLLCKNPENIITGWDAMRGRYSTFFSESAPSEVKRPSREWLTELKNLFSSDPMISRTWVRTFSEAEDHLPAGEQQVGMLRYLALMPFSYTGLHGYKLFLDVSRASNLSNKWLLTEMTSPMTSKALKLIAHILINFESRIGEKKKSAFKYARMMSTSYFQDLQTKNCAGLVYLEVKILKKFEAFGTNSNPENIIGIEKVPAEHKAMLSKAADFIVSAAPQRNLGRYSESMRKAMIPEHKPKQHQQVAKKEDIFG